ncbi:MAG: hypothetical protein ABFS39_16160 [Pseudomonadota bacterium]
MTIRDKAQPDISSPSQGEARRGECRLPRVALRSTQATLKTNGGRIADDLCHRPSGDPNAGLEFWRECQAAKQEQRKQILDQFDSLKWRSYGDAPALG